MRGTSGQVNTDNIVIWQFKNLDNLCSSMSQKKEIPMLSKKHQIMKQEVHHEKNVRGIQVR